MKDRILELEEKLKSFPKNHESNEKVDILNELAWELGLTDTKRAFNLTQGSMRIAKKLNYVAGMAYCYRNFGYCQLIFSQLEEGLKNSLNASNNFRDIGDKSGEASAMNTIALVFWRLGNYDEALKRAFDGLDLNKQINDKRGQAWSLHNIGTIYSEVGDTKLSIEYFNKSLTLFREIDYQVGEARVFTGLGQVYQNSGNLKKALQFYQESLALSETTQIKIGIANTSLAIGTIYHKINQFKQALAYYNKSLKQLEQLENNEMKAATLLSLGNLYAEHQEPKKAFEFLNEALSIIQETQAKPTTLKIHLALANLYEFNKDFEKALKHYKIYQKLKVEVHNDNSKTRVKNLQIRMQVEKSEKEAELHRLKNVELVKSLEELKQTQAKLIQSERMAALGSLVAGIVHEVNSPLGVITSSLDVTDRALGKIKQAISQPDKNKNEKLVKSINKSFNIIKTNSSTVLSAGERVNKIVSSLEKFANLDEEELQLVDIHEGLENTISLISPQLSRDVKINKAYGILPKINVYLQELNQVFMTLLVNATEAVKETGTIEVRTSVQNKHVTISISDTGIGISKEKLDKIFDVGFSQKDTRVRMHMGLANTYNIIQKHKGEIKVQSKVGKGTEYRIKLPVTLGK